MGDANNSTWKCLAAFGARVIVRLWPQETKDWGRAFAAEVPEIETFSASFRWLIGGAMLLTRERFRTALRSLGRPIGVPSNDPLESARKSSRRFPRTPRLASALLIVASVALLLHPETRTSIGAVVSGEPWNPERWSSFQKLRRKAAETGDAKLLSLLSLLSRSNNDRAGLSDQAIAKDPSFTWLDYRYFRPADSPEERSELRQVARERNARLQKWDPENAVPRLYAAEPLFEDILSASPGVPSFASERRHELNDLEKRAAANSQWLAAMDRAFSAPRYDTYALRRFQLVRDVARQYEINDPDITVYAVAGGALPQLLNVRTYARILLYRDSRKAGSTDNAPAIADAWKVLRFAQRMQLHGRTWIEDIIASETAQQACERLEPLLQKAGRYDEAALIALELERWNVALDRMKSRNRSWAFSYQNGSFAWAGLTAHIAVFAIVLLVVATMASCGFLFWRTDVSAESRGRMHSLCSLMVDFAPLLLLFASVALFLSNHPSAETYQSYFQAQPPSLDTESMENLISAAGAPHMLPQTIERTVHQENIRYFGWLSTTVVLSALSAFLLYRIMLPHRGTV